MKYSALRARRGRQTSGEVQLQTLGFLGSALWQLLAHVHSAPSTASLFLVLLFYGLVFSHRHGAKLALLSQPRLSHNIQIRLIPTLEIFEIVPLCLYDGEVITIYPDEMIHTYQEAECPLPTNLAVPGERAWNWVELFLQQAYFLLTVSVTEDNEEVCSRSFLLCLIHQVMEMSVEFSSQNWKVKRLDLISPGYLRGKEGYSLDKVVEVWRDKNEPNYFRFTLGDGTSIENPFYGIRPECLQLELALSF